MTFVCLSIVAANLTIVAWSVVSVAADMTFANLFDSVKAGKYTIIPTSEKLTRSEIEKVFIEKDKTVLSVVEQRLNMVEVTSLFSSYVKVVVKSRTNHRFLSRVPTRVLNHCCLFCTVHCYTYDTVQGSQN